MSRRWTALLVLACLVPGLAGCQRSTLPPRLSDADFWQLTTTLSEPSGSFTHSDNLVSNEAAFADVMRTLRPRGGVYIGVGPEQNYSYIAEVRPQMAFVVDVRSENRSLHLLYKALFELSPDRAAFVSRLFSRPRPDAVTPRTPVADLFEAFAAAPPDERLRDETRRLVRDQLVTRHGFALSARDLAWIDYAIDAFHHDGPDIHYARLLPHDPRGPSYRALMTAADFTHRARSYLSSDEQFGFVKALHARNLIVPVIGDFGGTVSLRRIAAYVRDRGEVVSAFYASNVEVYLNREKSARFCANLASQPYSWNTAFIVNKGKQPLRQKLASCRGVLTAGGAVPQ